MAQLGFLPDGAFAFAGWAGVGQLRLEVATPDNCTALDWLRTLPQRHPLLLPRVYYSARAPPLVPAGVPGQVRCRSSPPPRALRRYVLRLRACRTTGMGSAPMISALEHSEVGT